MPTGLRRFQQTQHLHFVTFSCYRRQAHFQSATSRELFENALERIRERYIWTVVGYVVMPEHVHLLVNEPGEGSLPRAIQALKLSVAKRRGERPFWQARYYDFNVWTARKTTEKLNYLHRNPVARGLVAKPEDWMGSSYRHYATGFQGTVEIESIWTAAKRGYELPDGMGLRTKADRGSCNPGSQNRDPGHPVFGG
jgi:putative transposase